MPEDFPQSGAPEPSLSHRSVEPRGVIQRNLKGIVYMGVAALVIAVAVYTNVTKKPIPGRNLPPQPMLSDNTDQNAQALKNQILADRQEYRPGPNPDYAPGGKDFGCVPGQPCTPQMQQQNPQQLTPEQQQERQLAAREKELAFNSRFASNIAYARSTAPQGKEQEKSSLVAPKDEQAEKKSSEINVNAAVGPPYVIREGTTMSTVLMNRLDGDAPGPVKVMVSEAVYTHDNQHVLIPDGTIVLGEAKKIGPSGFGQQRRIAVVFHRMIMPDGWTVDLDKFNGLDQIGEQGLKDKVNNHYLEIFGASIALGVIAGAAEVEMGGFNGSGSGLFTIGASSSMSSSATTILDRFIQIPPTITIREGHRVKIWFTQDITLPAWENHRIAQSF